MLLLICFILILICLIPLIISAKNNQFFNKYKFCKPLLIIIILLIIFFVVFKFLIPLIPHNDVSEEDRLLLEKYISDNYGLELKVEESQIVHRGNIGFNPGIEYNFVLKNNNGSEYHLDINELYEVDLKDILSKNPNLSLTQVK